MKKTDLDPHLIEQLVSEGVDLEWMIQFLNDLNAGKYDNEKTAALKTAPDAGHPSIIDRRKSPASWKMGAAAANERFDFLSLPFSAESAGITVADDLVFDEAALRKIGIYLYPKTAYGLLNGGCGTSYADVKKNRALNAVCFEEYRELFENLAKECHGKPKGLTPAYINPDGSPGYSFLLLKLRMLLEHKKRYCRLTGLPPCNILPAFQITSFRTDEAIQKAFREYILMDELKIPADSLGCSTIEMYTHSQSMMAAITHSSEGLPRRIFDRAWGKPNTGIALPGGHGQNFEKLAHIYRKMYDGGVRYVWIGNIDNMGYTVDPVSLAIFALSGKVAAFETALRTPMDVKGGILLCDDKGRFNCADIGPVLNGQDIRDLEAQGNPLLFNCGTGLFDLAKLIENLPRLPSKLPFRITDQDKDAGRYAQAEQITWEIIGLLDDPVFFAVDKPRRFIAAKMLLETIMTSQISSTSVHHGLKKLLHEEYGLHQKKGRWGPER